MAVTSSNNLLQCDNLAGPWRGDCTQWTVNTHEIPIIGSFWTQAGKLYRTRNQFPIFLEKIHQRSCSAFHGGQLGTRQLLKNDVFIWSLELSD